MASTAISKQIYNGKHFIVHNPNARGRQPRYKINDVAVRGVTTILGETIAKDLTKWAVDSCCEYIRTKLPVVTEADLEIGANEYIRLRDAGGNSGTQAHALVEQFLRTGEADYQGKDAGAIAAYNAFTKWWFPTKPKVLSIEDVVYSKRYNYAGTYDFLIELDGQVILCDLKTTNPSRVAPQGVYADNFLQLGAYAEAYMEQLRYEHANGGTELRPIDDLMIISAKKNGVLDWVRSSQLGWPPSQCAKMWVQTLSLNRYLIELKEKLNSGTSNVSTSTRR